jgi:DNA-binding CsgD family transcriptional regulator
VSASGPNAQPIPPGRLPFVGRGRELAALEAHLQAAMAGQGRAVLLAGEPGIGKTRTAEEFATAAEARGARVVWGRCYEGEGAPAFWPWVQVIRAVARGTGPAAVRAWLGPGAVDLAPLVPALGPLRPDLPAPPALDPAHARFRLFEATTAFLTAAGTARPLLVVLDDLHWADVPSLLLLEFLAGALGESRVLLLVTYRDTEVTRPHPLARTLAALARLDDVDRLQLGGLAEDDVARVAERVGGRRPPAELLTRIHRVTEGNPFFVAEVVRLLDAQGRLAESAGDAAARPSIPPRVREVIDERVNRLSFGCRRLLTVAAVVGRAFRIGTLGRLNELTGEEVLQQVEEAEAARIVAPASGALGHYRFVHALVRETLYAEVTQAERVRLHRQVGEALVAEYGPHDEPHLAELAVHFVQAAPAGDAERAIGYAVRAAERAKRLLAHEEAARYYRLAIEGLALLSPPDPARECDLLLAIGEAEEWAGEREAAKATFARAAEVARSLCSAERLAQAALGYAGRLATTHLIDAGTIDLIHEALAAVGPEDAAPRVRLLARLADELLSSQDRDRSEVLSREAEAIARRLGDLPTLAVVLNTRHGVLWRPDMVEQRLAVATELLALAETGGDRELAMLGRHWRIVDLAELGRLAEAEAEIAVLAELAEASRQPHHRWLSAVRRGAQALLAGRFAEAETLVAEALEIGRRAQPDAALRFNLIQLIVLRREQGRMAELEADLRELSSRPEASRVRRVALARIYAEIGRADEARQWFELLAADDFASLDRDATWLDSMVLLAETCALLGDARRATVLYALLRPYADRLATGGRFVAVVGPTNLALGRLAATAGDWSAAADHFAGSLAMCEAIGSPPFVARTHLAWAEMLAARNRPADRDEAIGHLAVATTIATGTGMSRVALLADHLRDRLGRGASTPTDTPARPHGLSRREVQVLGLLAAGRTTREIGAELGIGVSTVERHITNLYRKIGARGRADATAYAFRAGLAADDRS